jgi:starvation-inducible DNA-binding protein
MIAAGLNLILIDVFSLYVKTRRFRLHMSAPRFRDFHLLLEEQADELYLMTDPITVLMRVIVGTDWRSLGQVAHTQQLVERDTAFLDPFDVLAELKEDNIILASRLRAVLQFIDVRRDIVTTSLIENWIDETERRIWFLVESGRNV